MKPVPIATMLCLVGCATAQAPINIVVSHVNNEAQGLPVATEFCAQHDRIAVFHGMVGESFQFDCVKRPS